MKDLRECGEVAPSENGDPIFTCSFCNEKLNTMELIIIHITGLHKEKVTFDPDSIKKRPRRKRKSELPVSEWIHLENENKKKSTKSGSGLEKITEDDEVDGENLSEEKENSKPRTRQRGRPRREKKDEEEDLSKSKNEPVKKRGRKKRTKSISSSSSSESEEELPIKIRLKRRGKEMIIAKEEDDQPANKIGKKVKKTKNEVSDKEEEKEDECFKENEKLPIPMELPLEDKDFIEIKPEVAVESRIIDAVKKTKDEKEGKVEKVADDFIKTEKVEDFTINESDNVKSEVKSEDENSFDGDDGNNDDDVEDDNENPDLNDKEEESDKDFDNDNSFPIEHDFGSVHDESESDSDEDDDFQNQDETSSSSESSDDSESQKISTLKAKLQRKVDETLIQNSNNSSLDEVKTDKPIIESTHKNETENNKREQPKREKKTPKVRQKNEFGEYVCDLCGNTYKKATSLSRHRADCREGNTVLRNRIRKENGMYPCTYENCTSEYLNVEEVFKHEKDVHGKKKYARPQTRQKNEFGEYVCDICGNVYKKGTSLSRHRALCREGIVIVPKRKRRDRIHNENGKYQCTYHGCRSDYSTIDEVVKHEKETHKGGKKKKIGRMCDICGKWLTSACSFKSHMLRHSGERNYKCDLCSAAFYDKYALTLHKKVHNEEKEYECEFCQKRFSRAPEMRKHIRYFHLNLRPDPVMCDLCGKYFHWKFDLKSHMRRHYNVKTIRCEFAECEQMFANRSDLKKHLITHNPDVKPWQCEICSNSFSRKSTLVKHQKLHTGVKEYACSICGKAFSQSPGLYMHMKSHGFNIKPEGAGRYERTSHFGYRQMDPDRIANFTYKNNNNNNQQSTSTAQSSSTTITTTTTTTTTSNQEESEKNLNIISDNNKILQLNQNSDELQPNQPPVQQLNRTQDEIRPLIHNEIRPQIHGDINRPILHADINRPLLQMQIGGQPPNQ